MNQSKPNPSAWPAREAYENMMRNEAEAEEEQTRYPTYRLPGGYPSTNDYGSAAPHGDAASFRYGDPGNGFVAGAGANAGANRYGPEYYRTASAGSATGAAGAAGMGQSDLGPTGATYAGFDYGYYSSQSRPQPQPFSHAANAPNYTSGTTESRGSPPMHSSAFSSNSSDSDFSDLSPHRAATFTSSMGRSRRWEGESAPPPLPPQPPSAQPMIFEEPTPILCGKKWYTSNSYNNFEPYNPPEDPPPEPTTVYHTPYANSTPTSNYARRPPPPPAVQGELSNNSISVSNYVRGPLPSAPSMRFSQPYSLRPDPVTGQLISSFSNLSTSDKNTAANIITVNPNMANELPTLVAVFGKTGTGKTSFISSVTGLNLKAGHNLASATQTIDTYPYKVGQHEILLVDTPGFDDTNHSDTEILTMIADWMEKTYEDKHLLSGLIYLHKISDNRMDGASMKSLRLFRQLCGENNLQNVILGTTMWETVDEATGANRERELKDIYWKEMIGKKSSMRRISTNPDDARLLVESFLPKRPFVAQLQQELGSGKRLSETAAAGALRDEMEKMTKRYEKELQSTKEEMEKAHIKRNAKLREELKAEVEEIKAKLAQVESEKLKLESAVSSARLPKQFRVNFSKKWECLGGCGTKTSTEGRSYCKKCKITQKNVRG